MNGIFNIDKEIGITSHTVVSKMRRILSMKKIGHTGTLDPMASGVMAVCVGKGTKVAEYLSSDDKVYRAGLRLGLSTDTLDITGKVTKTFDKRVKRGELESALFAFTGKIAQVPPMYSAIKVGGRKLYDLARAGVTVDRAAREVNIRSIDLIMADDDKMEYELVVSCSKGTYIRSLLADIGEHLGTGGVMTSLRRERSGSFDIKDAITLTELARAVDEGRVEDYLYPVDYPFSSLFRITLDDRQTALVKNGASLDLSRVAGAPKEPGLCTVYGQSGELLMVARPDFESGSLMIQKSFFG